MSIMIHRTTRLAAIALAVLACNGEGTDTSWQQALAEVDAGNAIFSFMFVDEPPDGTRLRASLFGTDIDAPCRLFEVDADVDNAAPFWYAVVELGGTAPGVYEITPYFDEITDTDKASVALKYVESAQNDAYFPAVGGTVEILEAPGNAEEWHAGIQFDVVIDAEFPETPLRTLSCDGVDGPNGLVEGTCNCEAPDGSVITCGLESGQSTCCYNIDGPRVQFHTEKFARPCPWACVWLADDPGLFQYCQALF